MFCRLPPAVESSARFCFSSVFLFCVSLVCLLVRRFSCLFSFLCFPSLFHCSPFLFSVFPSIFPCSPYSVPLYLIFLHAISSASVFLLTFTPLSRRLSHSLTNSLANRLTHRLSHVLARRSSPHSQPLTPSHTNRLTLTV